MSNANETKTFLSFFRSILGVVTQESLINQIVSMNRKNSDSALKAINKKPIKVTSNAILGKVARVLEVETLVLVIDNVDGRDVLKGVVTKLDLLHFISQDSITASNAANGTTNGTNGSIEKLLSKAVL